MHLLASQPGGFSDDEGIVDLGQTPADMVILSAADSVLAALANSAQDLPDDYPSVRLANWMHLLKPAALDLYRHKVIDHAQVVVVSLLGGENYWQYGFEQLQQWAREDAQRQLIFVPGDDAPDDTLWSASTVDKQQAITIWQFLRQGGAFNIQQLLLFLGAEYFSRSYVWSDPKILPSCMLYLPHESSVIVDKEKTNLDKKVLSTQASFADCQKRWQHQAQLSKVQASNTKDSTDTNPAPICLLLFYRSHLQSANTEVFDRLIEALEQQGLWVLPMAVSSLKDKESLALINALLQEVNQCYESTAQQVSLIINATSFASNTVSSPDLSSEPSDFTSLFNVDVPILQLILSSSTEDDWQMYSQGLRSRDIAMQIVLPEMDGRIITRAVSFKSEEWFSDVCEVSVVRYTLHNERAAFVAQLAKNYSVLAGKKNSEKRIGIILANYPTKDGRIGNGVGLDTPESVIQILQALNHHGYAIENIPEQGNALIEELLGAVTNNPNTLDYLPCWQSLSVQEYREYFSQLPIENQQAVLQQWGEPELDPKCRNGRIMLSGIRLGNIFVGIQPARGFNMDLVANYHDPDLIPPHNYLAFYFWLRHCYQIDAVIHVGKHGNLEWLPGKGAALSNACWPDIALGALPHFYPFIVNDPGEGAQAKRRAQAVIIDHLMPPMTRAETYGELAELESWVDEYYQAMGLDTRREQWLKEKILNVAKQTHVLNELPLSESSSDEAILSELDTYLCDIKEAQIRHGLHILGRLPNTEKLVQTLVALLRLPRGEGASEQGILHNLVLDLDLRHMLSDKNNMAENTYFNPLQTTVEPWGNDRPELLNTVSDSVWRTTADTRERLEILAEQLVTQVVSADSASQVMSDTQVQTLLPNTYQQLQYLKNTLKVALETSAQKEIQSLIRGLQGRFIEPGPSGAPTRGRLDTLPTGRNFFSVDNRSIPSPAACALGELSAQRLIERHLQEHGDYPKQLGLSVWGTATMRTGGDDIAQAFALMGVKPIRAQGSQRVTDIEIIPSMLLGRPRVDVTLRVSGFFRDAFPNVMKLYDTAVLALANYDEPAGDNTIQKNIRQRTQTLVNQGLSHEEALRQASYRVFGSKPGAYGAGLQGLIDERCWETREDLAEAYVNWGGYAYGHTSANTDNNHSHQDGVEAKQAFEYQLGQLEAVVQNQDNREHDLLDSDDYYQFQGGMVNAVTAYSGHEPVVYHSDHSNPSSPKVRTLKEELNRVVRSRLLNPKWINAMQEHGYKGAFEMAASVDYLFAYDATTNLIDDYQYEQVADTLIFDPNNQVFMEQNNPNALEEMAERLLEATQRGMWQDDNGYAKKLQDLLLSLDEKNEG